MKQKQQSHSMLSQVHTSLQLELPNPTTRIYIKLIESILISIFRTWLLLIKDVLYFKAQIVEAITSQQKIVRFLATKKL